MTFYLVSLSESSDVKIYKAKLNGFKRNSLKYLSFHNEIFIFPYDIKSDIKKNEF